RPNNHFDQEVANGLVQYRPSAATSMQLELRSARTDKGDLEWLFDPTAFFEGTQHRERVDTVRLGLRRSGMLGGTLLGSATYRSAEIDFAANLSSAAIDADTRDVEIQHIGGGNRLTYRAGISYAELRGRRTFGAPPLAGAPPAPDGSDVPAGPDGMPTGPDGMPAGPDVMPPGLDAVPEALMRIAGDVASAYAYVSARLTERIELTVGASADEVDMASGERSRVNPKLGATIDLGSRTTLRLAAFQTLQGHEISRENVQPSLEPVDVAGFN